MEDREIRRLKKGCILGLAAGAGGILFLFAAVLVVALFLIKVLWAWTIPDLFPGAVEQGLIARSISWFTALKLAIFLATLAGIAGARRGRDGN